MISEARHASSKPSVVVSECVTMVNDDGGRVDVSGDNLIG